MRTYHTQPKVPIHCKRLGFTIVEMLLAMTVCSMLGTGVLTILASTLNATDEQNDTRSHIVRQAVISQRLASAVRSTTTVLAQEPQMLALWTGDLDLNDQINLSELYVLIWLEDDGELWLYKSPANLAPSDNTAYSPNDDFGVIIPSILDTPAFPGGVLIRDLDTFTIQTSGSDASRPDLLSISLQFAGMQNTHAIQVIASPRANKPME